MPTPIGETTFFSLANHQNQFITPSLIPLNYLMIPLGRLDIEFVKLVWSLLFPFRPQVTYVRQFGYVRGLLLPVLKD